MDPNPNPFVSPPNSVFEADLLPELEFRPTTTSFLVAIPFLVFCIAVSIAAVSNAILSEFHYRNTPFQWLIAITAAIGAYGCLTVFWCRVAVTERAIVKHDLARGEILFSQIEFWYHQPFPNSILVRVKGKRRIQAVNNWAMTSRRMTELGEILHQKIGPPSTAKH